MGRVLRVHDGGRTARPDRLTVEEPLEIRVAGKPLTITMRTPGDDFDLVAGFLVREGVVRAAAGIRSIRYCTGATAVRTTVTWPVDGGAFAIAPAALATLPDELRAAQRVFDRTGALHAAGLFDADGKLRVPARGRRTAQRGRQGRRLGGP